MQVALHVLTSHLLHDHNSQAALIDSTGNFDVLRLYQIIVQRIKAKQASERAAATSNVNPQVFYAETSTEEMNKAASQVLDRVKIMRVFDFVGVSEAVSELRDSWRGSARDDEMASAWAAEPTQKTHIADSQADDDDEDIMLFDGAGDNDDLGDSKLQPVSLIVVDSITSPVNPILKSNYVQGQ